MSSQVSKSAFIQKYTVAAKLKQIYDANAPLFDPNEDSLFPKFNRNDFEFVPVEETGPDGTVIKKTKVLVKTVEIKLVDKDGKETGEVEKIQCAVSTFKGNKKHPYVFDLPVKILNEAKEEVESTEPRLLMPIEVLKFIKSTETAEWSLWEEVAEKEKSESTGRKSDNSDELSAAFPELADEIKAAYALKDKLNKNEKFRGEYGVLNYYIKSVDSIAKAEAKAAKEKAEKDALNKK